MNLRSKKDESSKGFTRGWLQKMRSPSGSPLAQSSLSPEEPNEQSPSVRRGSFASGKLSNRSLAKNTESGNSIVLNNTSETPATLPPSPEPARKSTATKIGAKLIPKSSSKSSKSANSQKKSDWFAGSGSPGHRRFLSSGQSSQAASPVLREGDSTLIEDELGGGSGGSGGSGSGSGSGAHGGSEQQFLKGSDSVHSKLSSKSWSSKSSTGSASTPSQLNSPSKTDSSASYDVDPLSRRLGKLFFWEREKNSHSANSHSANSHSSNSHNAINHSGKNHSPSTALNSQTPPVSVSAHRKQLSWQHSRGHNRAKSQSNVNSLSATAAAAAVKNSGATTESSAGHSRKSSSPHKTQNSVPFPSKRQEVPRMIIDPPETRRRRKTGDSSQSRSRSSSLALSFGRSASNSNSSTHIQAPNSLYRPMPRRSTSSEDARLRKVLPLPPPPTIGLGSVMDDPNVNALGLDPMAVRYADHMHMLGYTRNRYVCALLSRESSKEGSKYNGMVMQAFVMRMLRFYNEPLDMSLRKFLFRMALPQEAQQIERMLHNFSILWNYQNPGIFADDEQVLYVVYSMVMLHTDAFNRNIKHKISKADYVRNAGIDGICPEIFEYFYDNITAVPFKSDDDAPALSPPSPSAGASPLGSLTEATSGAASAPAAPLAATIMSSNVSHPPSISGSISGASGSVMAPNFAPTTATGKVINNAHIPQQHQHQQSCPQVLGHPEHRASINTIPRPKSSGSLYSSSVSISALTSGLPSDIVDDPLNTMENLPLHNTGPSEDSGSMSSRRSSSFTWLRDRPPDPYPILLENRLDVLRPELMSVSSVSPFTTCELNSIDDLHTVQEQLKNLGSKYLQAISQLSRPDAYITGHSPAVLQAQSRPGVVEVQVIKYGVILRRESKKMMIGHHKPEWRERCVVLTNSRLYLTKNSNWVRQLNDRNKVPVDLLQTETALSTRDMAALVVQKNPQATAQSNEDTLCRFLLIEGGRDREKECFAVSSEQELRQWVQIINAVATQTSLNVSLMPMSTREKILAARNEVDEQLEAIQSDISIYQKHLKHFRLLAPLHQRTRESLVFTAGRYSSKCDGAFAELARLHAYRNILDMAELGQREATPDPAPLEPAAAPDIAAAEAASTMV